MKRTKKEEKKEMRKQERRRVSKEKGITLIALVVTIIVLIILAGVSIAILVGENGIITQAQKAKQETEQAKQNEEKSLQELEGYIDSSLGGETATTVAEAKGGMRYNNTTPITDDSGDTMYIPGGFKVAEDSATDIDNGVVITDGINEFVWIAVEDYTTMYEEVEDPIQLTGTEINTTIYSRLRIRSGDSYISGVPNSINLREPDLVIGNNGIEYDANEENYSILAESTQEMAERLVDEYLATYNSIKKYGGFYVGRYELSGTVEQPRVQRGQTVLVQKNWYNLKKACSNVVSTKYAQTTMIYGNQWDEVMSWLVTTGAKTDSEVNNNSNTWGNYNDSTGDAAIEGAGSKQVTGFSEYWKANNIDYLAGNC